MRAPAYTVTALSALAQRIKPADGRPVRFRSKTFALKLAFEGARPCVSGERYCVTFRIDGERGFLLAATRLLLVPVEALFDGRRSRGFSSENAALILEVALADELEAVEQALGAEVRIEAVSRLAAGEQMAAEVVEGLTCLTLELDTGNGGQAHADCFLPEAVAARLVGAWHDFDFETEVTAELRLGVTSLSVVQIAALQAGDVIMLERTPLHRHQVLLVVENCAAAMLDLTDGDEANLRGALESMEAPALEPFSAKPRGPNWEERELVALTAALARMRLPFSRIASIDLGAPFELPSRLDGPVSLWADDIELAVGRLVLAGDGFGFRITETKTDV